MTDEEVATTLTRIDTVVGRMEGRLFGEDGESGLLSRHAERLTALERTEAKAKGAFWLFCTLSATIGSLLTEHVFRSRH